MKKACGLQLLLYALIAGAVAFAVYRRFPVGEATLFSGLIGGFIAYLGVAYLIAIPGKLRERSMIRRALAGERPVDGQKAVAIGRLVPNGPTLTSPITKTPAIAYKYEIRSIGKNSRALYSGFALTPSTIQGSHGGVRLLAYPELEVKPKSLYGGEPARNAQAYVNATEFADPTAGGFSEAMAAMMAVYKDDDGDVRIDHKRTSQESDFNALALVEWVVRPGDQVCVMGQYSAQRGGIVPDPKMPLQQVTIKTGEPDSFSGRAMFGVIRYVIGGILCLTATIAGLTALYASVPLEAAEEMQPEMHPTWPEIRLERLIENRVRPLMRARGMLSDGGVATTLPLGTAKGRVNDTFVTRAVADRENGLTRIRLDDGVAVLTLDKGNRLLSLSIDGHDVEDPQSAELQIVQNEEESAMGRITWIGKGGLTGARVTFNARAASPDPEK